MSAIYGNIKIIFDYYEAQGITQMTGTLFHRTRELSTFQGAITNKSTR